MQGSLCLRGGILYVGRHELTAHVRPYDLDGRPPGAGFPFRGPVNERSADIGARRLHTVMERLLEALSFEAPDLGARTVKVDRAMVEERLGDLLDDQDLSQFIL